METRVCSKCGIEKDINQFPLLNQFTHQRQSYCVNCRSEMGKNWYARNKEYQKENSRKHTREYRNSIREYLWNYLLTHPCQGTLPDGTKCTESDPTVLEFHHLHSKDMAIAEMVTRITNIVKLEEELEKCIVLCSNCHRRLTAKERGWFRANR